MAVGGGIRRGGENLSRKISQTLLRLTAEGRQAFHQYQRRMKEAL
jgi:hypothetical protein